MSAPSAVVDTTLLRRRIVEDFTHDEGLKFRVEQMGLVLRHVAGKVRLAFAASSEHETDLHQGHRSPG